MDAASSIMRWEMYAPGTAIAFTALAEPTGIRVVLKRDGMPILSSPAFDMPMMFRLSQDLRAQLTALGFAAKPLADCLSVLEGGPCWGPAAPLQASLFTSLR
jgi:hypothetical protein